MNLIIISSGTAFLALSGIVRIAAWHDLTLAVDTSPYHHAYFDGALALLLGKTI
jgi:hypothetical protein